MGQNTKKRCCICKETKPIEEFTHDSSSPDGFSHRCKPCNTLRYKNYRKRNQEKEKNRTNNYYLRNRETKLQKERKYRLREPEKTRQQWRKYYATHRSECRERDEIYRERNLTKKYAENQALKKVNLGSKCTICGSTENLHRHHPNYSKPLEILTVCSRCHQRIHNGSLILEETI